jgi:hypothetical protein
LTDLSGIALACVLIDLLVPAVLGYPLRQPGDVAPRRVRSS